MFQVLEEFINSVYSHNLANLSLCFLLLFRIITAPTLLWLHKIPLKKQEEKYAISRHCRFACDQTDVWVWLIIVRPQDHPKMVLS